MKYQHGQSTLANIIFSGHPPAKFGVHHGFGTIPTEKTTSKGTWGSAAKTSAAVTGQTSYPI